MNFNITKNKAFVFVGIVIVEIILFVLLSLFTYCGVVPAGFVCEQNYSWLILFASCEYYCASINQVVNYYIMLLIMPVISYIFISLGEKK